MYGNEFQWILREFTHEVKSDLMNHLEIENVSKTKMKVRLMAYNTGYAKIAKCVLDGLI